MKKRMEIAAWVLGLGIAAPGLGHAESVVDPRTAVVVARQGPQGAPSKLRPAGPQGRADAATLVVKVHGFRNALGNGKLALWRTKDGFPGDEAKAQERILVPIVDGAGTVTFEGLEPGAWAIAVFHDENDNQRIDLGIFGIPKEGLGISRDARGAFGPPSFEAAKLTLAAGERRAVSIRVVYY